MADDDVEENPDAQEALMLMIEDQLKSRQTPEVKVELARLIAARVDEDEAKEMMALILMFHITRMTKSGKPFDYAAYVAELRRLPEIDYDQAL